MSNLKAIFKNLLNDGVAAPSSINFTPELPASNVAVQGRTRVARTTNTSEAVIAINFVSSSPVGGAALVRHNLTDTGATWRVRLYSGLNQTGTLVYDSGNIDSLSGADSGIVGSKYSYVWFTQVNALSSLVSMNNAGNPDGYLQVERIVIGRADTIEVNASFGAEFGWDEDSRQTRTTGGSLRSDIQTAYRKLSCDLKELTDTERDTWMEGSQYVGKRRDWLISLYPDEGGDKERDNTILVKFDNLPKFQHWVHDKYRTKISVSEA